MKKTIVSTRKPKMTVAVPEHLAVLPDELYQTGKTMAVENNCATRIWRRPRHRWRKKVQIIDLNKIPSPPPLPEEIKNGVPTVKM